MMSRVGATPVAVALALGLACLHSEPSPRLQVAAETSAAGDALAQIDAHVEQLRHAFEQSAGTPRSQDIAWVKLRLSHMAELDQYLRVVYDDLGPRLRPQEQQALQAALVRRIEEMDAANTREVQALVATHGWFRISIFGEQADHDAWLLVQHADHDPEFQRRVLEILEGLHPRGETSPANFAYLFDRVAISQGNLQRYGTQGECVAGNWTTKPLEQPDAVDGLRASVGLPPLAVYAAMGRQICQVGRT